MRIRYLTLIILTLMANCNTPIQKEPKGDDIFFKIINSAYKQLLIQESFPLIIYEYPQNIVYSFEGEKLTFDSITFSIQNKVIDNIGVNMYHGADTSFIWPQDKLPDYRIINTNETRAADRNNYDYFRKNIGKGFVLISIPLYNQDKNAILFKESKVFDFEHTPSSETTRFLLFKKKDKHEEWYFYKEYER